MIEIKNQGAQGDVMFMRVDAVPPAATEEVSREARRLIVTHSETGHHHAIDNPDVRMFREPRDPLICYLAVDGEFADVVHHRPFHTHETIRLPAGTWQVRRQREYTPEGWRRVED